MTVEEALLSHTRGQFRAWMAFFEAERDCPDLACHYLMQVAYEVHRSNQRVKSPNRAKLKHFKLSFGGQEKQAAAVTVEQASALAKARALAKMQRAGIKVVVREAPR